MNTFKSALRTCMRYVAYALDRLTLGKLTPDSITITGLLAHIAIASFIATRHYLPGAILLIIFGLFDTLDGELARLQKRDSPSGMLLDATTDRMKEILLYTAAAYAIVAKGQPYLAIWAVVACGSSLLVSYVKAKGETAIGDKQLSISEINRFFGDGLMTFEVRMATLVVGLLVQRLLPAVVLIAILSSFTAIYRLANIRSQLS